MPRQFLAILFVSCLIASCRPFHDPHVLRFRFWGDAEEMKVIQSLVQDFEKANPGAQITLERQAPDAGYAELLLREFTAGKAPDVIFVASDNFDVINASGQLADLGPWLAQDAGLKASDYYDAVIQRFSADGKLMALPRDIAPVSCVYYNKALFDAAKLPYPKDDWTWDDLRRDAIKLTKRPKVGRPTCFGFADDWNLSDAWILAGGGQQVDDFSHPRHFTFGDKKARAGILFRYKLQQKDRVMPGSGDDQSLAGGPASMFENGALGLFHSGLWKTPAFRHSISGFAWDVAPFPRKKGVKARYWSGGSGYAMRAGTADPALAWKLIKFLAGPQGQAKLAAAGLAQPALRSMAESPVFLDGQDPQNKKMLLKCAERAQLSPSWLPWIEFTHQMWSPETDPLWIQGYHGDANLLLKGLQKRANAKYFPKRKKHA